MLPPYKVAKAVAALESLGGCLSRQKKEHFRMRRWGILASCSESTPLILTVSHLAFCYFYTTRQTKLGNRDREESFERGKFRSTKIPVHLPLNFSSTWRFALRLALDFPGCIFLLFFSQSATFSLACSRLQFSSILPSKAIQSERHFPKHREIWFV